MDLFDYIKNLIEWVSVWSNSNFSGFWAETIIVGFQFAFIVLILFLLDLLIQKSLNPIILVIVNRTKLNWDEVFYKNKVFRSLLHLVPISIAFNFIQPIFHQKSNAEFIAEKSLYIVLIIVFIQLIFRIIDSFIKISRDDNNYTTIGIRTFGQLIKIISIFMAVIMLIALLFNIEFSEIITVLGALTAVLILVFRDTILGFVSGVQISTTKMVKVGDWIQVAKYDIEGRIQEINLTTVKIERFDKTLATVPTYDLISSHITNYMPMLKTKTRRIKRSIVFNIKSFQFLNDDLVNEYKSVDILSEFISKKQKELKQYNSEIGEENLIDRKITNIGLFRKYIELYLKSHDKISKEDTLLVRQMDISPQGIPLEIYCFTTTSKWEEYEEIQSDIFDHLLTKSKEFNLEIMQTITV